MRSTSASSVCQGGASSCPGLFFCSQRIANAASTAPPHGALRTSMMVQWVLSSSVDPEVQPMLELFPRPSSLHKRFLVAVVTILAVVLFCSCFLPLPMRVLGSSQASSSADSKALLCLNLFLFAEHNSFTGRSCHHVTEQGATVILLHALA